MMNRYYKKTILSLTEKLISNRLKVQGGISSRFYIITIYLLVLIQLTIPAYSQNEDYDTDWSNSLNISIDAQTLGLGGDIYDFPLLVRLDTTNFQDITSKTKPGGADIRFSKPDGTPLYYEIENWIDGTRGVAWVLIDTISSSSQTILKMYYNNPSASDSSKPDKVFNTVKGFQAVWHLSDSYLDATSNNNDGTQSGGVSNTTGMIGKCKSFDGEDDKIQCGSGSSIDNLDVITVEMWIFPQGWGESNYGRVVDKGSLLKIYTTNGGGLYGTEAFTFKRDRSTHTDVRSSDNSISLNQWNHVVAVMNSTNSTNIYINGTEASYINQNVGSGSLVSEAANSLYIGNNSFNNRTFDGHIDELRISNVVRSTDWIRLSYETQRSGQTVVTLITIPVTSVSLSPSILSLAPGQTSTLTANISPSDATNKAVSWLSSNTNVATVDANGVVTALAAGTAVITVTTDDGGKTGTCTVSVSGNNYTDWSDSIYFTIDAQTLGLSGDIYNFPLLVRLNTTNFPDIATKTKSGGADIRFSKSDGTPLYYEIENWIDGTQGVAWVLVDTISSSSCTIIKMYYNNPSASDSSKSDKVFNTVNGFQSVWHLSDSYLDATSNNNDGTQIGGVSDTTGMIAKCKSFDGEDDKIQCGSGSSIDNLNVISVEMWIFPQGWGESNYGRVIDKGSLLKIYTTNGGGLYGTEAFTFKRDRSTHTDVRSSDKSISLNQWNHVVAVMNSTTSTKIYINGTEACYINHNDGSGSLVSEAINRLYIGNNSQDNRAFDGHIDELRISNLVLSADWIRLSYETQKFDQTVVTPITTCIDAYAFVSDPLSSTNTSVTLYGSSTNPGVTYSWSGPGGFTSSLQNPVVSTAGTYILTVSNPANGCTATVTVEVISIAGETGTIWLEEFPHPNHTTLDEGITSWQTCCNAGTFEVYNNEFKVANIGICAQEIWTSGVIDISGKMNVSISVDVRSVVCYGEEMDTSGNNTDYIRFYYKLNSGLEVLFAQKVGAIDNHSSSGITVSVDGLSGTNLQIIIKAMTINSCEIYFFDNVKVIGGEPIDASASVSGLLTCIDTTVTLYGHSSVAGVTYSWSGPDGFTSSLQNPEVNTPGTYSLTVTDPSNGNYTVVTTDVIQNITLPDVVISNPDTLTCDTPSITLSASSPTPGTTYKWTGPGGYISTQQNPVTSIPGEYILSVTDPGNGCTSVDTIIIQLNNTAPEDVTATAQDTLTCTQTSVTLTGTSNTGGVTYNWSGPDGFSSTEQNPIVSNTGFYSLLVTDPENGCTSSVSVLVEQDTTHPSDVIAAASGILTCKDTTVTLTGSSSSGGVTYSWLDPNSSVLTGNPVIVSIPGAYILTVTKTNNGCSESANVTVKQDIEAPEGLIASVSDTLSCMVTSVILSASSTTAGVTYYWTGPEGFISDEQYTVTNISGDYTVTATNPNNGCISEKQVIVIEEECLEP